jgi:hypothetical protein
MDDNAVSREFIGNWCALKPVQPIIQLAQLCLPRLQLTRELALSHPLPLVADRLLFHDHSGFLDFVLNVMPHRPLLPLVSEPRFICCDRRDQSVALLRGSGYLFPYLVQLPRQCVYVLLLHRQPLDYNQSLAKLPDLREQGLQGIRLRGCAGLAEGRRNQGHCYEVGPMKFHT